MGSYQKVLPTNYWTQWHLLDSRLVPSHHGQQIGLILHDINNNYQIVQNSEYIG